MISAMTGPLALVRGPSLMFRYWMVGQFLTMVLSDRRESMRRSCRLPPEMVSRLRTVILHSAKASAKAGRPSIAMRRDSRTGEENEDAIISSSE